MIYIVIPKETDNDSTNWGFPGTPPARFLTLVGKTRNGVDLNAESIDLAGVTACIVNRGLRTVRQSATYLTQALAMTSDKRFWIHFGNHVSNDPVWTPATIAEMGRTLLNGLSNGLGDGSRCMPFSMSSKLPWDVNLQITASRFREPTDLDSIPALLDVAWKKAEAYYVLRELEVSLAPLVKAALVPQTSSNAPAQTQFNFDDLKAAFIGTPPVLAAIEALEAVLADTASLTRDPFGAVLALDQLRMAIAIAPALLADGAALQ